MKINKFIKKPSEPKESIGNCYFCNEPVYASEGQIIKHLKIIVNKEISEYPTHKSCRIKKYMKTYKNGDIIVGEIKKMKTMSVKSVKIDKDFLMQIANNQTDLKNQIEKLKEEIKNIAIKPTYKIEATLDNLADIQLLAMSYLLFL